MHATGGIYFSGNVRDGLPEDIATWTDDDIAQANKRNQDSFRREGREWFERQDDGSIIARAYGVPEDRVAPRTYGGSNETDLNQVPPQGGTQYADLMMATQEEQDRQAGQRSIGGYFPDGSYKSDAMVFNKGTGKWQPDNYDPNNPGHQPGY